MGLKIALAGNPNSGKTTLFNYLTGSTQYVGNWPGVTVEKKEGRLRGHKDVSIVDLPGIYSLSPYTLEEVVSRNFILEEKPDLIINIVDSTNIERNLYLTTQLAELGIPVLVALNMADLLKKRGDEIQLKKLAEKFGCEFMEISALKGTGCKELADRAVQLANKGEAPVTKPIFAADVEEAIARVEKQLAAANVPASLSRFYAIKLLEQDEKLGAKIKLSAEAKAEIKAALKTLETAHDDDAESIITNERYEYIRTVMEASVKKKKVSLTVSDKIDRVVTNRFLALPIFAAVMFIVYFIAISTVGTMATDWVNDGVFGDGFHLVGIGAAEYEEKVGEFDLAQAKIEAYIAAAEEKGLDIAPVTEALKAEEPTEAQEAAVEAFKTEAAQAGISAVAEVEEEDETVTEYPVDTAGFAASLDVAEPDPAESGVWVPGIPVLVEGLVKDAPAWLSSLVLDGIVGGVGAVLGFLPQMLVLFLLLAILEDTGYMARIAFIMDRIFRRFGLSGKSFIPMLVSTGCGVPGVMASRTIENERDRKLTIMTTTFMPCGAKLPIIAMFVGALFPNSVWVAPSAYFIGIGAIIVSGIILKKFKFFVGDPAPFVMELPAYHVPGVKGVLIHTWDRGKSFVQKAGTIIFLSAVGVWLLGGFNWSFQMVNTTESMLADMGKALSFVFAPLGFGNWEATVATITGLIAKENVVSTYGVLHGIAEATEDNPALLDYIANTFNGLTAYSFLVFNLLCAPCFAAIGAIRREMGTGKWTWIAVGYQTVFAYIIALGVYQFGRLFMGKAFGIGTVAAILITVGLLYLLFRPTPKYNKKTGAEELEPVEHNA